MSNLGCHVVVKLRDGRVIAPTPPQRRLVARKILEICRPFKLLVFHLVDSHLHLEFLEAERVAREVARRIEYALSRTLGLEVPFARAYSDPIRSQSHLYNTFDYVLRQQSRHGLQWDPYFEASSLVDLLGLRTLGAYTVAHVRAHLPRINSESLLRHLDLENIEFADGPVEYIRDATLAATALLSTRPMSAEARAAVIAGVHVVGRQLDARQLGVRFGVSQRSIERFRSEDPDQAIVSAIRRQLFLRTALQGNRSTVLRTADLEG